MVALSNASTASVEKTAAPIRAVLAVNVVLRIAPRASVAAKRPPPRCGVLFPSKSVCVTVRSLAPPLAR